MKKPLTIGLLATAIIAGALSLVRVDGQSQAPAAGVTQAVAAESEAQPVVVRMAQLAVSQPHMFDYERGPRIIHVPQAGERTPDRGNVRPVSRPAARASIDRRPEPATVEEDGDDDDDVVEAAPPSPPPSALKKKIRIIPMKPQVSAAPPPPQPPAAITPRWKLRGDAPPPPQGPRRALLSAPPSSSVGPTPLRPTPNFDTKAADRGEGMGEKFAAPSKPTAPATIVTESQPPLGYSPPAMPEQPSDEVTSAAPAAPPPEDGNPTN